MFQPRLDFISSCRPKSPSLNISNMYVSLFCSSHFYTLTICVEISLYRVSSRLLPNVHVLFQAQRHCRGIHCAGWNFPFPSHAELIIWRVSCLIIVIASLHFFTSTCCRRYENKNNRHHSQSLVIFIGHCVLCPCATHPLCPSFNRPEASSLRGIRCSRVDCPLTPYVADLLLEHHIDPILTWISREFLYHAPISHVYLVKRFV